MVFLGKRCRRAAFLTLALLVLAHASGLEHRALKSRIENSDHDCFSTNACCANVTQEIPNENNPLVETPQGYVWVFAYGGNMHRKKYEALGITPREYYRAILPDHHIRFDTKLAFPEKGENAFANVHEGCCGGDCCVHGVAYLMSEDEAKLLDSSEPTYTREPHKLLTYGEKKSLVAGVYVADRRPNGEQVPSERYAQLIYCGAKSLKLCPGYLTSLKTRFDDMGLQIDPVCHEIELLILPASGSLLETSYIQAPGERL